VEGTVAEGQDVITTRLGNLLSARLERQNEGGTMMVKRGTVSFGAQDKSRVSNKAKKLSRGKDGPSTGPGAGVWLVGDLPELSVEGWDGLAGGAGKAGKNNDTTAGDSTFPIAGANLHIGKLAGYGQSFSALHVTAARRGRRIGCAAVR